MRKVKVNSATKKISEKAFKNGIMKLIGETGNFQDWGGEPNDLYTSKLRHKGKRRAIAFAFKGPGTAGVLTPKKLGKNGDQIQRLFLSPAEIFSFLKTNNLTPTPLSRISAPPPPPPL